MIKELTLVRFKKYAKKTIKLSTSSITLLVGGNNSGKSTLLHAIAIWEFCKLILLMEKGKKSLLKDTICQGYGLSADEFLPVAVPSLKHLWTNLKTQKESEPDGYTLRIGCKWDLESKNDCYLEIGLSLANDRLFIKTTESNLEEDDKIPTAAYLPTFAGILEKESKLSIAERRRLLGKGMAGSVLRNIILEMFTENIERRKNLREGRSKIKSEDLAQLRANDSFELLQKTLREIFNYEITVMPFNELYHTYIRVECYKGEFKNSRFIKFSEYSSRDVMVEGSGFLQWLSVYSLVLNEDIDVLLLDEPDAHLHSSLQQTLLTKLEDLGMSKNKQILIATHSTEIIKNTEPTKIFFVDKLKYLTEEQQKIGVIAGLGSEYAPKLSSLQKYKKLFLVENCFDFDLLKIWAEKIGHKLPEDIVVWPTSAGHKERKQLYLELKKEILQLKAISIRDRDDEPIDTVSDKMYDKTHTSSDSDILYLKWKRRNIENYLLFPPAIARATGKEISEVEEYFTENHALSVPKSFTSTNVPSALCECDGKKILIENINSVCKKFMCSRHDIAKNLAPNEICEDIISVINVINSYFSGK